MLTKAVLLSAIAAASAFTVPAGSGLALRSVNTASSEPPLPDFPPHFAVLDLVCAAKHWVGVLEHTGRMCIREGLGAAAQQQPFKSPSMLLYGDEG
jgi:hypothetical protein